VRALRISLNELPEEIRTLANHEGYFRVFLGSLLDEVERELIRRTITLVDGNNARASEILGVPRRTLYGKLERYDGRQRNPTADLTGTDTARRAMIVSREASITLRGVQHGAEFFDDRRNWQELWSGLCGTGYTVAAGV
jgi:hypothetical protein